MYQAFGYAIYVTVNLALFTATNPMPTDKNEQIFGIVYTILAFVLTWAAIAINRRKAALA